MLKGGGQRTLRFSFFKDSPGIPFGYWGFTKGQLEETREQVC